MSIISENQAKEEFLAALLNGQRDKCSQIAWTYYDQHQSLYFLYENIIKDALYKIGELWEYNKISVATEHLASAISQSILNEFYAKLIFPQAINKKVVVACVENELHQIGVKMISDVFELNGWTTFFLGSNTPTNELLRFIKLHTPDLLAISMSLYFHFPQLEKMLELFQKELPMLPILVGGQAFNKGGVEELSQYERVIFKQNIEQVDVLIKQIS